MTRYYGPTRAKPYDRSVSMDDLDDVVAADKARRGGYRCDDEDCQSFAFDTEAEMRAHVASGEHIYPEPELVNAPPVRASMTITTEQRRHTFTFHKAIARCFTSVMGWMVFFAVIGLGHEIVVGLIHAFGGGR